MRLRLHCPLALWMLPPAPLSKPERFTVAAHRASSHPASLFPAHVTFYSQGRMFFGVDRTGQDANEYIPVQMGCSKAKSI